MTVPCTILIPTKDRPGLLTRALTSALKAAPRDAEILVVDDGSSPPAQAVVDSFGDPRLRLVVNHGASGAAGTRNFGMLQARGTIVFFLDDDDELMPNYCDHILTEALLGAQEVDYGFSAYKITTSADSDPEQDKIGGKPLPDGVITHDASFRHKVCGFSMGFWIRSEVFKALGPLAEYLTVGEDIEYSFRLINADKAAWYSTHPGIRTHRYAPVDGQRDLDHLTTRTDSTAEAACLLVIYKRYPRIIQSDRQASRYLAHSYLKLTTRSGRLAPGWQMTATLPKFGDRMLARSYVLLKFAAYRLAERRRGRAQ